MNFHSFEEALNLSSAPSVILDSSHTIVWCNNAFVHVTGKDRHQLLNRRVYDAFPSGAHEQAAILKDSIEQVLNNGVAHQIDKLRYDIFDDNQQAKRYYWQVLNTPLCSEDGNVQFVLNQPTNITDLVQVYDYPEKHSGQIINDKSFLNVWAKERSRMTELFERSPSFICILKGRDYVYETANQAYFRLIGRDNIIGKRLEDVLPELVSQGFIDLLNQVYDSGEAFVGQAIPVQLIKTNSDQPEFIHIDFVFQPILNDDGMVTGIFIQGHDVTENHLLTQQIHFEARHDPLTGLFNRREMEERSRTLEFVDGKHAVLYMDLDHFKIVNDRCGHHAGDQFLKRLAEAMDAVDHDGLLARIGGDEFVVILENCASDCAEQLAQQFLQTISELTFFWEGSRYSVGVSIGIAFFGSDATLNFSQALANADSACFLAKDKGRSRIQLSDSNDIDIKQLHRDMDWTNRLKDAMRDDRIELFGQKIVKLQAPTEVVHKEVLSRLRDENNEIIAPGVFITAAERYGLIEQLDRHILRKVFLRLNDQRIHACRLFVNVSGITLSNPSFVSYVDALIEAFPNVNTSMLCIEITETAAVTNLQRTAEMMQRIQSRGIEFALDDFGSGVATFNYLEKLPISYVKIDGEFIQNVTTSPVSQAIVASIRHIAEVMNLTTIAERIEEPALIEHLQSLGINLGQGYAIHRPEPL